MFFHLGTLALVAILVILIVGSAIGGQHLGRSRQQDERGLKESSGVLQGALLGFMGLILAFGLSLALGRYEARRATVVADSNAIGTTYLRAQTLAEPIRSQSLPLLVQYTDLELRLTHEKPDGAAAQRTATEASALHRELWALAGQAVTEEPTATAPRLYMETLNDMIDLQTTRVAGLNNRVPTEVFLLQVAGSMAAMFLLGLHVGVLGRSRTPLLVTAGLVTMLLFVTFDLDRPTRGFITIPDASLSQLRSSMDQPPAFDPSG